LGFESLPRSLRNPLLTGGFSVSKVVDSTGEGNAEGNTPLGTLSHDVGEAPESFDALAVAVADEETQMATERIVI
jgi:hypothetical protein